jgi:hypothetical protein
MEITPEKTFVEMLEVSIDNAQNATVEFSPDGRFLAILVKDPTRLTIYEIPDEERGLEALLTDFNNKETFMEFTYDENIDLCNYIEFDVNNRYLVSSGPDRLNIIALE